MVHGIEDGKDPSELSDKELIRLWRDMGIKGDYHRLFELEEGTLPETGNAFEAKYTEVSKELKDRDLL